MIGNLEIKQTDPVLVTATAKSTALDLADYEGPVWFALSGTAAGFTHAVKLVEDAISNQVIGPFNSDEMKRYVKLQNTVSGGTGTSVVSLAVIGQKKYR